MTNLTFDAAYAQLEQLVRQLEQEDTELETLAQKVRQAKQLIAFCEQKLRGIEADLADSGSSNELA